MTVSQFDFQEQMALGRSMVRQASLILGRIAAEVRGDGLVSVMGIRLDGGRLAAVAAK